MYEEKSQIQIRYLRAGSYFRFLNQPEDEYNVVLRASISEISDGAWIFYQTVDADGNVIWDNYNGIGDPKDRKDGDCGTSSDMSRVRNANDWVALVDPRFRGPTPSEIENALQKLESIVGRS